MRYCSRCVLPDTRPNLELSDEGVCNACNTTHARSDVDWEAREGQFSRLVESVKSLGLAWDCVVPVSGGKDSTWQVLKCLEYGLRPLCVTWRTPARSALGQRNLDNLIELGVDHFDISINPHIERAFALRTLRRCGSPAIPMHMALFALPLQVAVRFEIPLVVWGENSAVEYGGDEIATQSFRMNRRWLLRCGVTNGTTVEDWIDKKLPESAMSAYRWPTDEELEHAGVGAVFLGWYFPWDPVETYEVAREHGFRADDRPRTGYYTFADVDDDFLVPLHHWIKWYKFGFTRLSDNLSLEIRHGRMTRDEAIAFIRKHGNETPRDEIERFCSWAELRREVFNDILERHRNTAIWQRNEAGQWHIPEFLIDDWDWQ